jgi:UDP-glucose 4-epimerase
VDVVFHLAGTGVPHREALRPDNQYWANVATTRALTDAILASGYHGRLVFASSASVYGDTGFQKVREDHPLTPCTEYGHRKAEAEAWLVKHLGRQCDLRIARLFHVFGLGQRKLVVYDLSTRILAGHDPLVVLGTGQEARDFVFVRDAVRALIILGIGPPCIGPQIINVCSGIPTRIRDLVTLLLRLAHRNAVDVTFQPEASNNPILACIGDNTRLVESNIEAPKTSANHFAKTLSWIRGEQSK